MDKKALTEADIRTKFITPALVGPVGKWNVMTQLREDVYFTKGRVIVRGKTVKRGEARKADYFLFYKPGIPTAVIEAIDLWREIQSGKETAYLLKSETMKKRLIEARSRKEGIPFDEACKKLGI